MNFTLQELKEASQELEFLLSSITKAEASLRAGGEEYKDFLAHIAAYKKELMEPMSLLNKALEDLEQVQENINAATLKNEQNFRETVSSFDDAIKAFEERAKNLSSIIDLSEFEKQLSDGLKKTIGEIITAQKTHLETLAKIAKTLDDATKKFETTANEVEKRLVTVEKKTGETLDKLSAKMKDLNLMTIGPWVFASSVVSITLGVVLSSLYFNSQIESAHEEAAYFAERMLPDDYYGAVGRTKYLAIDLDDQSRKVWKDGKRVYVEIK